MTPSETYAQKRDEAIALIRAHAPARLQDALIALLRPAIALSATRANDEEIPLGASKFGGAPDVPSGFVWPTWNEKPLGFLAQINLEEVAPFDVKNLLPKSGLLSFFYFSADDDNWPYGLEEQKDGWRVFHFVNEPLIRREVPIAALNEYPFACESFEVGARWTVSDLPRPYYLTMAEEERDALGDYHDELWFSQPLHQIFGNPKIVQNDVRFDAPRKSQRGEGQDWHLLLQIDTDDALDFMWGDTGTVYFLIHQDNLKAQDFGAVWCIADCC